jgi:hypothetical protein
MRKFETRKVGTPMVVAAGKMLGTGSAGPATAYGSSVGRGAGAGESVGRSCPLTTEPRCSERLSGWDVRCRWRCPASRSLPRLAAAGAWAPGLGSVATGDPSGADAASLAAGGPTGLGVAAGGSGVGAGVASGVGVGSGVGVASGVGVGVGVASGVGSGAGVASGVGAGVTTGAGACASAPAASPPAERPVPIRPTATMRVEGRVRRRRRVDGPPAGAGVAGAPLRFAAIGYRSPMLTSYVWPSSSLTAIRW